jgi:hypothetical protein
VCAAALVVPAFAQSEEPPKLPVKGRVLLLPNERILEGEITQVGEQYCIAREGSGQTWLPCSKARRLFGSRMESYQYLRTQANLDDADERMRLAQWCIQYELWPQALIELKAANQLRPEHDDTLRRLAHVERRMQAVNTPPTLPPGPIPVTPPPRPAAIAKDAANGLDLNSECIGLFARRVQPILMNTCARCHASGKAGEFKLTQVFGDAPVSGVSSQQNLTAVLSQISPTDPKDSPLLRMAASAHGGAPLPPLRNRETPAYRTLEQWVQLSAKHKAKPAFDVGQTPAPTPEPPTKNVFENVESKQAKAESPAKKDAPSRTKETFAADEPEKHSAPADEFDPIIFNRQMHPNKK